MTKSPAQFAVRTMRALEVLAFNPSSAPQLADALGVHPRTARRLLSQLRRDGWLTYSDGSPQIYAPTLRLVALAGHVGTRAPLAVVATPFVEALHRETGLESSLSIPSYSATTRLVRCIGDRAVQPPIGAESPAHCTAAGKVLLAHRDAWRESVLEKVTLRRCTAKTVTDARELRQEFVLVRGRGYAQEHEEFLNGVHGVAAPVRGPDGNALAALAVSAGSAEQATRAIDAVRGAAAAASAALQREVSRYPLRRGVAHRLLTSYGLAPIDAYL